MLKCRINFRKVALVICGFRGPLSHRHERRENQRFLVGMDCREDAFILRLTQIFALRQHPERGIYALTATLTQINNTPNGTGFYLCIRGLTGDVQSVKDEWIVS